MKTLQKYLFLELTKIFIPVCIFFITTFALGEFFWRLPDFVTYKTSVGTILYYLFLHIPLWFVQTMPMTVLLSTLITISHFMYTRELIAIKSLGINLKLFFIPWVIFGLILSIASFWINDKIATVGFHKAQMVLKTKIKKEPWDTDVLKNLSYYDFIPFNSSIAQHCFVNIGLYDKKNKIVKDVILHQIDNNTSQLRKELFSAQGTVVNTKEDSTLILYNTILREYKNNFVVNEKRYEKYVLSLKVDIEDFQYNYLDQPLDRLSIKQLRHWIKTAKFLGKENNKFLIEINFRYAVAAVNFILILLSIPLGQTTSSQYGKLVCFSYTIGLTIIYWTLLSYCRELAEINVLNPNISMWIPNILFLIIGTVLYLRKN